MTTSSSDYDHLLKILLVGDSNVGKTSILLRFANDTYDDNQQSTLGVDLKVKLMTFNDKKLKLTIWDTAGQERFRTLTSAYYRGAHGIILVYDVTCEESLINIKEWLNEIDMYCTNEHVIKILVGNKIDCKDERKIERKKGEEFAQEHNMLFIETSAKTEEGIKHSFEEVVQKILDAEDVLFGNDNKNNNLNMNDYDDDNDGEMECVC